MRDMAGHKQELPPVRPNPGTVDIVRIPGPDRIESLTIEVEGCFQRRRVVEAQVGAKPVDDARFGRHIDLDHEGKQMERLIRMTARYRKGET